MSILENLAKLFTKDEDSNFKDYEIQQGESLTSIATDNKVSVVDLMNANKEIKNPDYIRSGTVLKIPPRRKEKKENKNKYTIQKGDNLYKIAKDNNLNLNQLLKANSQIKNANQISVGQEINVPQFGVRQQQEFKKNINAQRQASKKRILPSNVRQLLYDISPISSFKRDFNMQLDDFTEADLDIKELEALKDVVRNNLANNKKIIEYDDYKTSDTAYGDVGGGRTGIKKVYDKFNDPYFSMKTLVGQGTITTNDRGETVVVDRYNFNEENPDSIKDYAIKAGLVAKDPFYQGPRQVGSIYGSDEGEGSYVRLNLGKL
tara:strand:+ start:30 stop:983 length:954 start_codon:yes stop_codon:yes gene_type:complete